MEHLSFVLFFRGSMAAMMASSNTDLRPAWVTAEQSRSVTRPSSLTTFSASFLDTCLCLGIEIYDDSDSENCQKFDSSP